jgi:hypothetical protein
MAIVINLLLPYCKIIPTPIQNAMLQTPVGTPSKALICMQ